MPNLEHACNVKISRIAPCKIPKVLWQERRIFKNNNGKEGGLRPMSDANAYDSKIMPRSARCIGLRQLRRIAAIQLAAWVLNSFLVPAVVPGDNGFFPGTALSQLAQVAFLFLTVEELRCAQSKLRYALKLLLWALAAGLFCLGVNLALAPQHGVFLLSNFLYDLFYASIAGLVLESLIRWKSVPKRERWAFLALAAGVVLLSALLGILTDRLHGTSGFLGSEPMLHFLRRSAFPGLNVMVCPRAFLLLGAFWYAFEGRKARLIALACYALCGLPVLLLESSGNYWAWLLGSQLPMKLLGQHIGDMVQLYALLAVPLLLSYRSDAAPQESAEKPAARSAVLQAAVPVAMCCCFMLIQGAQALGWL